MEEQANPPVQLLPVSAKPPCPKCGTEPSSVSGLRYCPGRIFAEGCTGPIQEHLHKKCSTCEYPMSIRCKDGQEVYDNVTDAGFIEPEPPEHEGEQLPVPTALGWAAGGYWGLGGI
jgi:hypothetical protein